MSPQLELIPVERIQSLWPIIRQGLEEVLRLCHDWWLPEDVYWRLQERRAHLHRFGAGFCIIEFVQAPHGQQKLNVWILHAPGQVEDIPDLLRQLENIAAQTHCKSILFSSPRKGWARVVESFATRQIVTYERDL